jgi:hypothetical protein
VGRVYIFALIYLDDGQIPKNLNVIGAAIPYKTVL